MLTKIRSTIKISNNSLKKSVIYYYYFYELHNLKLKHQHPNRARMNEF